MAIDEKTRTEAAKNYWSSEGYSPGGVIREVNFSEMQKGVDPLFEGIKIVDCDTHFTEAPDLFTSRVPASMKDKVPQQHLIDGMTRWTIGGLDFGVAGGNVIRKDKHKLLGRLAFPTLDEGTPASYQVKPRLEAMDDLGIYAQICYHNSGVTQPGSLMALDGDIGPMIIRLYNEAGAERQEESGQRLFAMAHLPYWDKQLLDDEARRCIDMGLKGFVLPDKPENIGAPSYDHPYWADFLEMCEATGTPINFHLNISIDPNALTWDSLGFEQSTAVYSNMFYVANLATMGNWMVSGVLDRYPRLKIGLIESGMGWIPYGLEALEHQFDEILADKTKAPQRRPWDYWRDNFWCTYWFEKIAPQKMLQDIGVNKVLFETDFPHPTSLYPGVQSRLVETLGHHTRDVHCRVLERNAAELYNLPF